MEYDIDLNEANSSAIEDWIRQLRLQGLKDVSIKTKTSRLSALVKFLNGRELSNIKSKDLEDFYLNRKDELAPITVWNEIREIERFYKFFLPDRSVELFKNLHQKRPRIDLPSTENVLNPNEIQLMLDKCTNQRDRALIMIL